MGRLSSSSGSECRVPTLPETAPFHALGAERGWILLLVLGVWAYDTVRISRPPVGPAKFLTHIRRPSRIAGLVGGLVASTVVVAVMLWGLGQDPSRS